MNRLPLKTVCIYPTNRCNHCCWYCAYQTDKLSVGSGMSRADFIPKDKMLEILADCEEMGVEEVVFSGGGEPFLMDGLREVLKALGRMRLRFGALSNGSKLHGEAAELFARYGSWLRISLEAANETQFYELMERFRSFKALGGPCLLRANLLVTDQNHDLLEKMAEAIRASGADSLNLLPVFVSDDMAENQAYHAPFYAGAEAAIQRIVQTLATERFPIDHRYCIKGTDAAKSHRWKPELQQTPIIGADLEVYAGTDRVYAKEGRRGSIQERRFLDFWEENGSCFNV